MSEYVNWLDKQDFSCPKPKVSPGENWVNEVEMEMENLGEPKEWTSFFFCLCFLVRGLATLAFNEEVCP